MLAGAGSELFDIVIRMDGLGTFAEELKNCVEIPIGRQKLKVLALDRIPTTCCGDLSRWPKNVQPTPPTRKLPVVVASGRRTSTDLLTRPIQTAIFGGCLLNSHIRTS